MPRFAYLLLPLIGGAMIAAQAPVNARLRLVLSSPVGRMAGAEPVPLSWERLAALALMCVSLVLLLRSR